MFSELSEWKHTNWRIRSYEYCRPIFRELLLCVGFNSIGSTYFEGLRRLGLCDNVSALMVKMTSNAKMLQHACFNQVRNDSDRCVCTQRRKMNKQRRYYRPFCCAKWCVESGTHPRLRHVTAACGQTHFIPRTKQYFFVEFTPLSKWCFGKFSNEGNVLAETQLPGANSEWLW